ncbi:FAD-dependent oxidoreductase [Capillimicrobium parvum]|uniref:FAD/NAD(P)-binding domain-containing protein n=1 Tax=Capillimicrobium parvum TaxID=2884022 RepID=A0A9E6XZC9_9ACTN|nr:FAD-dependent oxidoreductase [Capillimicrobium parvum]UGS36978.1 hypothetical protein DSM104329_03390 [Capillimicrobium parvum]
MPHPSVHVVIAGGGVAGLETVLALRDLAGRRVRMTLVTMASQTIERPITVAEPFDRAIAPTRHLDAIAADLGVELVHERLAAVRPHENVAVLSGGGELAYDRLVVATGAGAVAAVHGALTFHGAHDVDALRGVRDELRSGAARSVAFALASESVWPVPLYELALMMGADLRGHGVTDAPITIVTPEQAPLALFGPRAAEALAPLMADRGVRVHTGARPVAVESGRLVLADGADVDADRVVALPVPHGKPMSGLPTDRGGFIPVDRHGRVAGVDDVYAAGDAIAFPLKQGGLAAQQADAVAEAIAASAGAPIDPQPFSSVIRGMLLIGGAPLYLRAEVGTPGASGTAERIGGASVASGQALWWPPSKVAARYLGPYLATARPSLTGAPTLVDRAEPAAAALGHSHEQARDLALLLADSEARWGDFGAAVRALEAAQALDGVLPPAYERKRERWLAAR